MTIDLGDYEKGAGFRGDYGAALDALQERLRHIQVAHIVHHRRALILFEGWDAAGKGGIIQRLTAKWDPRHFEVWPISAPTPAEKAEHYLERFRRRLPPLRAIGVFDRSWYGRVLVERVEGFATEAEWRAGYDEISAFEADLAAQGITLIKLFIHVTQETQDERLKERLTDPWKRWKTGADDFRNRARRADYLAAMADMFARTDRPGARWTAIDGNNEKAARIAALTYVADRLEQTVPMVPPPLDPALKALAEKELGLRLD
ncbi:polyphosphate kinase [Sphingomonas oleivorans]|uniref:Polyphosphate kinase n=1 Tax=Sphingomonas oleivorans TaxID=1735121 RepID=A0A2T5FWK7_9SPHN|nr:polyphosphate kinase [Sphingomonas oleivorans]PTQ10167.1 polyphosphate kinase [Sphingomonas oleivorans]